MRVIITTFQHRPDGTAILLHGHDYDEFSAHARVPPATPTVWEHYIARTYSNDALCPICETRGQYGSIEKRAFGIMCDPPVRGVYLEGYRIQCTACAGWVLRVEFSRTKHYFLLEPAA